MIKRNILLCSAFSVIVAAGQLSWAIDVVPTIRDQESIRHTDSSFEIQLGSLQEDRVFGSADTSVWPLCYHGSPNRSRTNLIDGEISLVSVDDSQESIELFSDHSTNSAVDDSGVAISADNSAAWHWLDTLTLFGGLEGSKQPQDFGVNANFGSRWAANWGFPLLAEYGIGGQIGTSFNHTDNAVQVFERVGATNQRNQNFSTIGLFQRTDTWRWGLGYDVLYESYYDQFLMGQWRGRVGYATSERNEFGVWFAIPQQRADGSFLTIPVQLSPLAQGSAYWQHQFSAGSRVMTWAGIAQGHAQANLALGDLPRTGNQFVFGAEIDVPLNNYFSIYGQANFIGPADTGTVDSFLGVTYYPGGQAFPANHNAFSPFQALANSTMFAADLRRR